MEYRMWGPFSTEEMQEEINKGRQLILNKLFRDEKISLEDYEHYSKNFAAILAVPTSLFSKIWQKLLKKPDSYYLILVEEHTLVSNNVEEEEKK